MDDDSFDPRSWTKLPQPFPPGHDVKPVAHPELRQTSPLTSSEATEKATDSHHHAATVFLPQASGDKSARHPPTSPVSTASAGKPTAQIVPLLAGIAVLLAGGAGAWLTRTPVAVPVSGGAVASKPEGRTELGAVERRLLLAGSSDIVDALTGAGVSAADAQAAAQAATRVLTGSGEVHATIDLMPDGTGFTLQRFEASYGDGTGAVVVRDSAGSFSGTAVAAEITKQIKVLRGELDTDSFYSSAVAAGLVDTLIPEFINAFSYDFNIASEVSPGDTFEVAYQQPVDASGNPVGKPELLFGSLTTKTKSLALYRFQTPDGQIGWFDGNGASTQRGLMRTPVDGARITSVFGMRFHPVLHYNKMHKGVDFAAPIGTPIYAAKDGIVLWAAMKGPNGNLTILQHDDDMQTYYLHQSMFMPGIAPGVHVHQGETIGKIGTTGRSTGPHLHFEVHLHGQPVDPLSIPSDNATRKKLDGASMQAFIAQRNRVDVARAHQDS